MGTATGYRIGSRAVNRLNIRDISSKNNYVSKMKDKEDDLGALKIDFDNLPIVDSMAKASQKRRKLNMNTHRNKR